VRDWLEESRISPDDITFGVRAFLMSGWGGSLFECFGGGRSLIAACKHRDATYSMIIGTGNGKDMGILAQLLEERKIRAVIDKEFQLEDARDAVEYLAQGRCAGKVVVNIVN
jgi:NADPH:quinone reductase-like Zn-dependent oxidoreductase